MSGAGPCPKIDDTAVDQRFADKACGLESLGQQLLAALIEGRARRSRDQVTRQLQYVARCHQALNSSLMLVLARVCASTRFTITAQARLCVPSPDGKEPGTTTEPDGTRP